MTVLSLLAAATEQSSGPGPSAVVGIVSGISVMVFVLIAQRRAAKSVDAATGGVTNAFAMAVSPSPMFKTSLTSIRAIYGDSSPLPRMSGTSRPVVTANSNGLTISELKLRTLVRIPSADITSVTAGTSRLSVVAPRYPTVWVHGHHAESEFSFALAPLPEGNQAIKPARAHELARELTAHLGLAT